MNNFYQNQSFGFYDSTLKMGETTMEKGFDVNQRRGSR
jgi:hypothetical protein